MTTHHFYSEAAQWPDVAPLNYETAETVTDAWWDTVSTFYNSNTKVQEYRWYREDDLIPPWGAPARVTSKNIPGKQAGTNPMLPPQVALCVTEYTGYQERQAGRDVRHWGRFYLPAMGEGSSTPDGAVELPTQTAIADATDTWYAGLTAAGLVPSVRITGWGGTVAQSGWVPVQEIRVDDIWDTIRRRKWESPRNREIRDTFAGPEAPG